MNAALRTADDVVEIAEGGVDALPDGVRGQVRGGLQAEPGAEHAGDDRIEQLRVGWIAQDR